MRGVLVALLTLGFAGCSDPEFYQQRLYVSEPRLNMTRINGPGYQMDVPAEGIRDSFGRPTTQHKPGPVDHANQLADGRRAGALKQMMGQQVPEVPPRNFSLEGHGAIIRSPYDS